MECMRNLRDREKKSMEEIRTFLANTDVVKEFITKVKNVERFDFVEFREQMEARASSMRDAIKAQIDTAKENLDEAIEKVKTLVEQKRQDIDGHRIKELNEKINEWKDSLMDRFSDDEPEEIEPEE